MKPSLILSQQDRGLFEAILLEAAQSTTKQEFLTVGRMLDAASALWQLVTWLTDHFAWFAMAHLTEVSSAPAEIDCNIAAESALPFDIIVAVDRAGRLCRELAASRAKQFFRVVLAHLISLADTLTTIVGLVALVAHEVAEAMHGVSNWVLIVRAPWLRDVC